MEPNQKPPTPPAPAQADPPPVQPSVTSSSSSSSGSKMMWMVLVIVAVLIVAAVVGYMYMSGSKKTAEEVTLPVASSSPSAKADDLQSQLDSDQIEDVDADFAQMDQDLQNL